VINITPPDSAIAGSPMSIGRCSFAENEVGQETLVRRSMKIADLATKVSQLMTNLQRTQSPQSWERNVGFCLLGEIKPIVRHNAVPGTCFVWDECSRPLRLRLRLPDRGEPHVRQYKLSIATSPDPSRVAGVIHQRMRAPPTIDGIPNRPTVRDEQLSETPD
jgi:hypothetical protein